MNRADFQRLSSIRRKEAKHLLDNQQFQGAYYLAGYSVECALKACICKQTKRHDFPDKQFAQDVFTHVLEKLVIYAGLKRELENESRNSQAFEINWSIVKDWKETKRYDLLIGRSDAEDLYSACTSRPNGVLIWIKRHW